MTPALKAMVEAMVAEMPGAMISRGEVLVTGCGWVNLEKVTRAGLAAMPMRVLSRAVEDSMPAWPGEGDAKSETAHGYAKAMIDAILKE